MPLRFIGEDGFMGLRYGRVYRVTSEVCGSQIWVVWGRCGCPYDSLGELLQNWEAANV